MGCFLAGILTFFIGIPIAYLGAITRTYYGPDSPRAAFETDVSSTVYVAWNPRFCWSNTCDAY